MSKRQILILIGVWIMLILRLGFPVEWSKNLLLITGIAIIAIAYKLKPEIKVPKNVSEDRSFVDHKSI